jgi:hypothetical protein
MNPFAATREHPHHISVGVVLVNDAGQIACHYYADPQFRNYPKNFYTLLHETVEMSESLETAVARGLREEFSMTGTLVRYVGSMISRFELDGIMVEKTVPYFLCTLDDIHERDLSDPEAESEIMWMDFQELISIMKTQGEDDESKILEDVMSYYLR